MRTSSTDRTYNFIRDRLLSGELNSADRLREAAIAKEIGVSRTPVREALRRLQSEGLIDQTHGCGASVKSMSAKELRDIFELREVLECHAVSRAGGRLSKADIAEMEGLCEQIRQVAQVVQVGKLTRLDGELLSRFISADLTFHRKLVSATGNSMATKMLDDLHILGRVREYAVAMRESNPLRDLADTWRDHVRILRAVARGDSATAIKLMTGHLNRALEQHLDLLENQPKGRMGS